MKDGEIWVLEYKLKDKWIVLVTGGNKKTMKSAIKNHFSKFDTNKKKYRVSKYVRQGKYDYFDPVCRKCGDPLTTKELIL